MKERGQTSVEYIFMILAVSMVAISVFKKLENEMVSGNNSMINRYLGAYKTVFGGNGTEGAQMSYKRFPLHR